MSEIPTPVDVLTAKAKEWQGLPEGAWKRDLEAMEGLKMLPVTVASLYEDLALVPGESTGSQNRLLLATAATLTQTRNPEIWANKELAGKVMETVKAAIGEGYDDLPDQWDKGEADNYSLLRAAGIVFGEMKKSGQITAMTWVEKDQLSLMLQKKVVELEKQVEALKDFGVLPALLRKLDEALKKGLSDEEIEKDLKSLDFTEEPPILRRILDKMQETEGEGALPLPPGQQHKTWSHFVDMIIGEK